MHRHDWIRAAALAGVLVMPSTGAMAAVVEMIVIPCTPDLQPDKCGLKLSVAEGSANFTTSDGQTVAVPAGMTLSVSGAGVVSLASTAGNLVNFAATDTGPDTTASIGVGAGGGGSGGQIDGGGAPTSPPPPPPITIAGNPPSTPPFTLSPLPGATSVSP
jgi:hypothetical protein